LIIVGCEISAFAAITITPATPLQADADGKDDEPKAMLLIAGVGLD